VSARLKRDEDVCPTRRVAGIAKREYLGMRLAGAWVKALADNPSVGHDDAPDQGVGRGRTTAMLRHSEGTREKRVIDPG
jgi:hypothetical protein